MLAERENISGVSSAMKKAEIIAAIKEGCADA